MNRPIALSEEFKKIRENLHFVLLEPESPGNIGAAARALKTCGFSKLVLVNPVNPQAVEAKQLAHRSKDILAKAKIFSSFKEAIGNKKLVVGTTMRTRNFKFPFYSPDEIAGKILPAAIENPVAIVFGRERTGLTNEELLQCQLHSTIPIATQNPALNLAQAVMLYAHTFFMQLNSVQSEYEFDLASQRELEIFYEHLSKSLQEVNFTPRDGMEDFITRLRRLLGRSMAERRDISLLHKLLQIFETRIHDLEKQVKKDEKRKIF